MHDGVRSTRHSSTQTQALENSVASEFASLAKHLAINVFNTSPTTIGRIHPFFMNIGDSDALQSASETYSESLSTASFIYQLCQYS